MIPLRDDNPTQSWAVVTILLIVANVLAFFYGTGGNGKNTLMDFVLHIVGDYGKPISTATLMEARGERHPTDIANLLGVRLAVSNEVEEGGRWAESKLKALTGDAVLSARFMRQDFFEFKRTHKLVERQSPPSIRVVDDAVRRRIHLVPGRASSATHATATCPTQSRGWRSRGRIVRGFPAGRKPVYSRPPC
jgi:P4 family phage/plasmid primase-like protien